MNNYSQFSYDGSWQNRKIVETTSGSVTSTKQFVTCNGDKCEDRDAGGSVSRRFFKRGESIGGTSYFFTKSRPGSTNEMTDGSAIIQAQYSFDAFGRATKIQGSMDSDFQYAGYYFHQRSGLNLAMLRLYSPKLARWLSRDPIGEAGGVNLYTYVDNEPLDQTDPEGTATMVEFKIPDWIQKFIDWLKKCIKKPPKKPPEDPPPPPPPPPPPGDDDGGSGGGGGRRPETPTPDTRPKQHSRKATESFMRDHVRRAWEKPSEPNPSDPDPFDPLEPK